MIDNTSSWVRELQKTADALDISFDQAGTEAVMLLRVSTGLEAESALSFVPPEGATPKVASGMKAMLRALNDGAGVQAACYQVGIAAATFYRWRVMHPKFEEAVTVALNSRHRKGPGRPRVNK